MWAWQWEATLLPLPESARDDISQGFADALGNIDRGSVPLDELDVSFGTGAGPYVRITNDGARHPFELEVSRTRVLYRHAANDARREAPSAILDPEAHIRGVAAPLLQAVADDERISGRFLTVGLAYELSSVVAGRDQASCARVVDLLAGGLRRRPWEARLPAPRGRRAPLPDRLELRWAVDTEIGGGRDRQPASTWFVIDCPPDDGSQRIDATVVLQSAAGSLPSPRWAADAVQFHRAVWPTIVALSSTLM